MAIAESQRAQFSPRRARAAEPSYPVLPAHDDRGETSVRGIFVVGESAGTPLLKLGINAGARLARHLRTVHEAHHEPDGMLDVVVVGGGAAGLSCAVECQRAGLSVLVIERARTLQTVRDMPRGKHLYDEPLQVAVDAPLWFGACTREELLARWDAAVKDAGVRVVEGEAVVDVFRVDVASGAACFDVTTSARTVRTRRVVLAVGKAGPPRAFSVPGLETLGRPVRRRVDDANAVRGQRIVVVGGGDVACEAALALAAHNHVTLVARDASLGSAQARVRAQLHAAAAASAASPPSDTHKSPPPPFALGREAVGEVSPGLHLRLGAAVSAARPGVVVVGGGANGDVDVADVAVDAVYVLIGRDGSDAFFDRLGVAREGAWTPRRLLTALFVFACVYTLYALKKFPEAPYSWPFTLFVDVDAFRAVVGGVFDVAFAPFAWAFSDAARADIQKTLWFQQGYLYSLAYTLVMIGFGRQALLRWTSTAKDPRYQRLRYASLLVFQVVFFLLANVVAVQGLSIQHSWRAWGLYQPWPLFFNTFNWWNDSDPRAVVWFFVGAGLIGTFVAIPLLSWRHGKRFCTFVCGCGGLAETLGDRYRHLAPKGARSRAWEVQGLAVLVAAAVVTLITVGHYGGRADNAWAQAYSYVVDFWLVAVIPIALYPFFGGKVWCRYWCPLAAWNQVLAKAYGQLGIASTDGCISCGQCSKQCQVGVDVMSFARRGERFDNANSSCIHCGICVDVCPVSVLSFDTKPRARGKALPIVS